jgi:predicted alpha/beta-fold hydrolase
MTINYLAMMGREGGLVGGIAFSAPLNFFLGTISLEKWYNMILNRNLANSLVQSLRRSERRFLGS